uniref:Uncharacterized protein LOC104240123 isoform X2 n=1 Tax=Nicotiana sylvestris TaxID=4096 RepID=A0A1U7Y1U8_NICSY|nr:PREDICTED: uncharacterized protein LOC104240123 isoform X2 [Nicotiana sylvestris]
MFLSATVCSCFLPGRYCGLSRKINAKLALLGLAEAKLDLSSLKRPLKIGRSPNELYVIQSYFEFSKLDSSVKTISGI